MSRLEHPPPEIAALALNDKGEMTILFQEAKTIPALAAALHRLSTAIQTRRKTR